MDHREAEELLGAYALGALDGDEVSRMEEHLASCREHAAAAAELRQAQSLLALTPGDVAPPAELRARIVKAVNADQGAAPVVVPIRRTPRAPRWAPRPAYLALAAGLLLAGVIGGWFGYQLSQTQQVAYSFAGQASLAPGAQAHLVYFKDRKQAVLTVTGLPRLSAGQVYEAWLIKGGRAVDEGVGSQANGSLGLQIPADVSGFDQLAITIEPGEQPQPTSTPILTGQLHS